MRIFDFPPSDLMRPRYCRSADSCMRMQNALLFLQAGRLQSRHTRPKRDPSRIPYFDNPNTEILGPPCYFHEVVDEEEKFYNN